MFRRQPKEAKSAPRSVSFVLFHGDNVLPRGQFVVTATAAVSVFPDPTPEPTLPGENIAVGLFRGAMIRHELRSDGSAQFEFQYFFVRADSSVPIGWVQDREFAAAVSMASETGAEEWDAVDVGDEYRLAFNSQRVA